MLPMVAAHRLNYENEFTMVAALCLNYENEVSLS